MDRIIATDSPSLIMAYENHIKELEVQKELLREKMNRGSMPERDFDKVYNTALEFLKNPRKLWLSERIEDKRTLLKIVLTEPMTYNHNTGNNTALTSSLFMLFKGCHTPSFRMVEPWGIEPQTSTMPLLRSPS